MKPFPNFEQRVPLGRLTSEQYLVIAAQVVAKLNWEITSISELGLEAKTNFSWRSWYERIEIRIQDDAVTVKSVCSQGQKLDWGKNKMNVELFCSNFDSFLLALSQESLDKIGAVQLINLQNSLEKKVGDNVENTQELGADTKKVGVGSWFIPVKGYLVTPSLMYLNLAVFLLMVLSGVSWMEPTGEQLIDWGANIRLETLDGQWWRLITAMFVHIGLFHLVFNMYALLYIGLLLEPTIGSRRFLLVYLLSGILASVASIWYNEHSASAGASGAIFGMFGLFLVLILGNIIPKAIKFQLLFSVGIFIFYNLISGLKGDIDNAAHIGGLITGICLGVFLLNGLKNPKKNFMNSLTEIVIFCFSLTLTAVTLNGIPNDMPRYEKNMKEVSRLEEKALEALYVPLNSSQDLLKNAFEKHGIQYWERMNLILKESKQLEIPSHLIAHNELLIDYSLCRKKTYEFYWNGIVEETDKYNDSITFYNDKISFMLRLIGNGN